MVGPDCIAGQNSVFLKPSGSHWRVIVRYYGRKYSSTPQPAGPVETFSRGGVAAWRVAPRVAPARSAPLEKMVNFSSRYARILSKIGALRHARYARSDHGQIGALRALNLANGALRASQLSLTEICVKCFFSSVGSCPSRLLEWCLPSPSTKSTVALSRAASTTFGSASSIRTAAPRCRRRRR